MPDQQQEEKYRPLALIAVVIAALLLFAVFFLAFLVAPLAILALFYILFAASDRSKRAGSGPPPTPGTPTDPAVEEARLNQERLDREASSRRSTMEGQDREAGRAAERLTTRPGAGS
ncbi:hypothetical protein GKE82_18010 [Conexibacter sp. W3-3-2]|uniref:Uncharacterized protein n=1 Tax=Paraconexibacter algicola TaxID=2133960 RepID=A0A2T4UKM3_9ACTN|nr:MULTISPECIES: hypothetical protein [Solirubrobacterales]MTD46127.1 hypothetical protein [Conexibacter sp. W3-3-2]PTL59802.1 hypothetical protein C7Y72_09140 [Paraconexibacter algicola]